MESDYYELATPGPYPKILDPPLNVVNLDMCDVDWVFV